jgi:hypothetical protein
MSVISRAEGDRQGTVTSPWIYGRATDAVVALVWIPVFLLARQAVAGNGPLGSLSLTKLVDLTLLFSFMHQPLTLPLVYADGRQFSQRRALFTWAPVIALAAAVTAVGFNLWVVVPIAAIWNTIHTLQQRYGLCRIYSRKAGYGSALLDRAVLYLWMAATLLLVAANPSTKSLLDRVDIGANNDSAVRILTSVRPYAMALLVPVAALAVIVTVAIFRQEATAGRPNAGKWLYQASSLALIASIAINPIAGFVAYVAAHAIEYVIVVYRNARSRTAGPEGEHTPLGRMARTRLGRAAFVLAVMAFAGIVHAQLHQNAYLVVLYTVGALHFLYDGVIWKLRKPAIAASFAITS